MATAPRGTSGAMFMHTLSVQSGNLNFLEACYHMYTADQEFPGTLLSTGTEDYYGPLVTNWAVFVKSAVCEHSLRLCLSSWVSLLSSDSAWYFNAGEFHFPVSGFTHMNTSNGVTFSAYRFHEMDPLTFQDGFQVGALQRAARCCRLGFTRLSWVLLCLPPVHVAHRRRRGRQRHQVHDSRQQRPSSGLAASVHHQHVHLGVHLVSGPTPSSVPSSLGWGAAYPENSGKKTS